MPGSMRCACASLLLLIMSLGSGCEYVRPIPNVPLEKWEPGGGYRFTNVVPPGADNSDSLLFVVAFSGGGTRASALAFGALRELANQQIAKTIELQIELQAGPDDGRRKLH